MLNKKCVRARGIDGIPLASPRNDPRIALASGLRIRGQ
jgi:hypothetical protein